MTQSLNEPLGWLLISLGFFSGALLGMRRGAGDAWAGRLLRLGHIALCALGMINILFALSLPRIDLPAPWAGVASALFIAGGVLMPACCALAAGRPRAAPLLALPTLVLIAAGTIAWVGLLPWRMA